MLLLSALLTLCEENHMWLNSFWPSDTIWRHKSGSTCWLIISKIYWHSYEEILQEISLPSITWISVKITYPKFHSNLPGANDLKNSTSHWFPLTKYQKCGALIFSMMLVRTSCWANFQKLSNKQLSCRWFEAPCSSCDVTVLKVLKMHSNSWWCKCSEWTKLNMNSFNKRD